MILKKENKEAFRSLASYLDNKTALEDLLKNPCFKQYDNSWKQAPTPAQKKKVLLGEKNS